MRDFLQKTSALLIFLLILFSTIIPILAIWDMIEIEHLFRKTVLTIFISFFSIVIVLFIATSVFNDYKGQNEGGSETGSKDNNEPA